MAKHGSEPLKGYSKMAIVLSDRTIVLHLLRGAVPERADDLSRLWREHGHDVEVAPSGLVMERPIGPAERGFSGAGGWFAWLRGDDGRHANLT